MLVWIAFVVFGLVGGLMVKSFMAGRSSLGTVGSIGLGIVGSFVFGILFFLFGKSLVGDGPDFLVSILSAGIGAIIVPLIATLIKK